MIIVQPDGLLAVFSTAIDGFELVDGTDVEVIEHLAEQAAAAARLTAERSIARARENGCSMIPSALRLSWETALRIHGENHPIAADPALSRWVS